MFLIGKIQIRLYQTSILCQLIIVLILKCRVGILSMLKLLKQVLYSSHFYWLMKPTVVILFVVLGC